MTLQHLGTSPKTEDYTPLQEHEEQTPTTFFGAKPVLYVHQSGLTLSAPAAKFEEDVAFAKFKADREGDSEDALIKDVEIWVNSENLVLFQTSPTPTGVKIPYPTIALHATLKHSPSGTDALLLNLSLNDTENINDVDEISTLELTILAPNYTSESPDTACIKEIFTAMNTCADLHPDADDDGEDGMGEVFDETAPGATGWITAENIGDFVDADGNLDMSRFPGTIIGGEQEELGPGAGTVRTRDEEEGDTNGVNGDGHEEKYIRTG